ncbi:MAG: trypsin-like peptidase domain-containing protein [Pirellulales bacterium]|nr:trypsin-like peptidase domain-containing protein [Pirellulales bacterium]
MVRSLQLSMILLASLVCQQAAAKTILLEFTSPSCGPCRAMRPVMRQLAASGCDVREIDSSQAPGAGIAASHRVAQLPTFIVLVDGQERARAEGGGRSLDSLIEMVNKATAIGLAKRQPVGAAEPSLNLVNAATGGSDEFVAFDQPKPGRVVPIGAAPPLKRSAPRTASNTDALISSTVRLSIEDPDGKSTGTGTIIDAREGKALVLTCGHLFRSSGGKGPIELTLFTPGPNGAEVRTVVEGTLIDYDLERDLALVCFAPDTQVAVAPVAATADPMQVGQPAVSVGCEHGANPTPWPTKITALNRYQGPPNIEAAGAPVEGRSGGGLFNDAGQLVGVCNAADPQRDEGLYASLASIHAKLDSLKLTFVYQTPALGESQTLSGGAQLAAAESPFEVRGQNPTPPATADFPTVLPDVNPAAAQGNAPEAAAAPAAAAPTPAMAQAAAAALSPQDQAVLDEINRRGADSEVICIIRPREPGGRSDVIKIDRASPALVQALSSRSEQTPAR